MHSIRVDSLARVRTMTPSLGDLGKVTSAYIPFLVCEVGTVAAPTSQVVAYTQTVPRTRPHTFFLIHISYCCHPSSLLLVSLAS